MNSSLLAGLGAGTGLVLAAAITASLLLPLPPESQQSMPTSVEQQSAAELPELEEQIAAPEAPTAEAEILPSDTQEPELAVIPSTEESIPAEPDTTPDTSVGREDIPEAVEPDEIAQEQVLPPEPSELTQTEVQVPEPPEARAALHGEAAPQMPPAQEQARVTRLPSAVLPRAPSETTSGLPSISLPQVPDTSTQDSAQAEAADAEDMPPATIVQREPQPMPGLRVAGLPQIGTDEDIPAITDDIPALDPVAASALVRNSLYQFDTAGRPRMALVLSDPGLPAAMRRALASIDIPLTIALNPLDSSAADGAEIYRAEGKEILILATSLPAGATASDLDVTFGEFFRALPQAVGVIDLPEEGFSRNSSMLSNILPLLAQDGHGLVTFAGGLAQAGRVAQAAGIAHAEVFRMLERGSESPFTIRRYLDRAMFHASQTGEVIVFGDASNNATMDALEMWLADGRAEQIAVVPVSAILLQAE